MRGLLLLIGLIALILGGCASRTDLEAAQAQISTLQASNTALQADLSQKAADFAAARAKSSDQAAKIWTLEKDVAQAKKDFADASSRANLLAAKVGKYECSDQIAGMRYDSVMTASTMLSAWWAQRPNVESVSTPYRDKIWSNALTQIHGITYTSAEDHKPYVEHFLVYFDEFGMKPGVFWVGGQCWLDAP